MLLSRFLPSSLSLTRVFPALSLILLTLFLAACDSLEIEESGDDLGPLNPKVAVLLPLSGRF